MDPTPLQQTVMEPTTEVTPSTPLEDETSTTSNSNEPTPASTTDELTLASNDEPTPGSTNDGPTLGSTNDETTDELTTDEPTPASTTDEPTLTMDKPTQALVSDEPGKPKNTEQAYEPLSYDELFPALPNTPTPATSTPAPVVEAPPNNWTRNSDMRIASSVITQVFRVPHEERAKIDENNQFGESASSRICTDITNRTGAHIEISSAKDQSLTFLVTGKNEAVLKARRLILEKFQTQAKQIVLIPKEHHKYILGKKGKKLQEIEAATSTKVHVPMTNENSEEIVILGPKDSIDKAVHEIRLISDEQSKQAYEKVEVPKQYHPFICGANNEEVNKLVAEHNVRINFPPLAVMKNEFTIAGEKEGVIKCREIILKKYNDLEKKCQTISVEVRKSQHKYVIGPRGSNITEILAETGVSIEMPTTDSPSETITLRGPQDKLASALTMVYAKANSIEEAVVEAPHWLHKFIIGKKGANIKQITQDLPKVHVEFIDKQGIIKLEGPPEEVSVAKEKLETMIDEMQNRLSKTQITVDPKHLKHVIGKSGVNINRIRNETGTVIKIEEQGITNIIRIEGSVDGVIEAKKQFLDRITKVENEKERDIIIENHLHGHLIGSKGNKIQELRDSFNQVQILFPDYGKKSDIVTIKGPKEDVDQCYTHMQRLVRKLQESNHQIKLPVFKQFFKHIIGKGGSTIHKIYEETNTRVDIPSGDAERAEIIITGRKEDCEKARDLIQKIQQEAANIVESDIMIPSKFHLSMIGQKGKFVQSISEECGGVYIKFPPSDSNSDKVSVRGPKEDVQKAKQILLELSNEKQLFNHTDEVRAKPQHHRFIIGKNGQAIKKIKDATNVKVVLPSEKDEDKELITIIGKKENVAKAKEMLILIIKDLEMFVEDKITVNPKYYRHFLGKRFEVLSQIIEQFGGVQVVFPRAGDPSDQVFIKGPKECVEGAKNRILEIAKDLDQITKVEVIIPQKYHRTLMGPRGSRIQSITSQYDVQIKFPDKENRNEAEQDNQNQNQPQVNGEDNGAVTEETTKPQDTVVIIGKLENCEAAKEALNSCIPITVDVAVPFAHHRFIIGQKGDNVRAMMSEYDINIVIPPAQEQSDVIKITGAPSKVELAKEALEKKVAQIYEDELDRKARSFQRQIDVAPEYHPKIIGRRGAVISKIRDKYSVNIQFPPQGERTITITGYEKNCEEALAAILKITGDLDNLVKSAIDIDIRVHSRLIGKRGISLKKVMEEYKVEIQFPRKDDNPNEVIILGSEENVEECKEHLLNLAEEYLQDVFDEMDMKQYETTNQSSGGPADHPVGPRPTKPGFVVTGAPWAQEAPNMNSSEDFPSMGAPTAPSAAPAPAWGPRR